jgi:hypothetical protein
MSKLNDYSKFDKLVDSDDDEDQAAAASPATSTTTTMQTPQPIAAPPSAPQPQHTKDPNTGRYIFTFGNQKVYEWEQSLDSVTMYIDVPPGKTATDFVVTIKAKRLQVGLKGHDRMFLDENFFSLVDTTESCWFFEDGVLQLDLIKQRRGETWECVLKGTATENPVLKKELKEQLLLERFQEENPGMDFRGATFNGSVPDPRSYMGGIGYNK